MDISMNKFLRPFHFLRPNRVLAAIFILSVATFLACDKASPSSGKQLSINSFYEIYLPHWGESNVVEALNDRLTHLRGLFVEAVILSPMQPVSDRMKIGQLGSPFAIKDFSAYNEAIGHRDSLKATIKELQMSGMSVFMDWYPNLCAFDSDFYEYADSTNPSQVLSNRHNLSFNDVALIDLSKKDAAKKMLQHMKDWQNEFGLKGFRVHYPDNLPADFLEELKETGAILVGGEGSTKESNVDYFMDYEFFDCIEKLQADSSYNFSEILGLMDFEQQSGKIKPIHFSNNQFLSSRSTNSEALLGVKGRLSTATAFISPGAPLMLAGQEIPFGRPTNMYSSKTIDWPEKTEQDLFREFILLRQKNRSLQWGSKGQLRQLEVNNPRVLAFEKKVGGHILIGILNFSDDTEAIKPEEGIFNVNDYQKGRPIQIRAGQEFKLAPSQFLIFTNL